MTKKGEVIATVAKGDREQVRVIRQTWRGNDHLNVRTFVRKEDAGAEAWIPTQKGITLRLDAAQEVLDGMKKALDEGHEEGT